MTDDELKDKFAELAVAQIKTEAKFEKTEAQFDRTEAQMRETDAQIRETDAQMKLTVAQMKRTDATLERLGITLGNVTNNIGSITEEYFFNSLFDKPVFGGVKYNKVKRNIGGVGLNSEDEFDIVMYNGDSIALIECKNKAHKNDLVKLIEKKSANFRDLFPYYSDYKIYLGLASFSFYPELEELAKQNGVAILKQKGDIVVIEAEHLRAY